MITLNLNKLSKVMILAAIAIFGLMLSNKNLSHNSDTVPIFRNFLKLDKNKL
jgi:hypothetical protein